MKYDDRFYAFKEEFENNLKTTSLSEEMINTLVDKAEYSLIKSFAGQRIEVPKKFYNIIRDKKILSEYEKGNTNKLARKYDLTKSYVEFIIRRDRETK